MNQYLFKYDDEQKEFRLLLLEHFTKKRGRRVPYNEILADLQREAVRKLKLWPPMIKETLPKAEHTEFDNVIGGTGISFDDEGIPWTPPDIFVCSREQANDSVYLSRLGDLLHGDKNYFLPKP